MGERFWDKPQTTPIGASKSCSVCGGSGYKTFARYPMGRDGNNRLIYEDVPISPDRAAPIYMDIDHPHAVGMAMGTCDCIAVPLAQARLARAIGDEGVPDDCLRFSFADFEGKQYVQALRYANQLVSGVVWDESDDVAKPGLLLLGLTGTGKTTLASLIYRARIERGQAAVWTDYTAFVKKVQDTYGGVSHFSASGDKLTEQEIIRMASHAPFLMLDDLGSKKFAERSASENRNEIIYMVLNHRWAKRLPTVITTNLTKDELYTHFDTRVVSRIRGLCAGVVVRGTDYRAPGDRT